MAEFDFFEITGIPLSETKPSKIESLLSRKERELNDTLAGETQDTARHEIEAKIKFLADIRAKIFDGKKISKFYSDMVKDKTDELKRRLQARILLEKNSRKGKSLIVTNGKIRKLRNNHEHGIALSLKDIQQAYIDNGFTINDISPLSSMPQIPDRCGNIHKDLERLREKVRHEIKTLNSDRPNADFVSDLYNFTAYISGDINNFSDYKNYSAAQLKSKLEPYLTLYAGYSGDTIEKLEAAIAGSAVSFIFDSEAHRSGYDSYILITKPELEELFDNMKGLLESDLRDPDIAELCIRKIAEVFGNYDTALAIYNSKAKLINDPYIPDRAVFLVRCAHCQTVCEFSSPRDAQSQNKCTNCGEKLYKSCPECGKPVLFSLSKCPGCGYVFPDVDRFNKLMVMAENALRNNNFNEARNFLANAGIADSTEHVKTRELEARITRLEEEYNRPLRKLNDLISCLKFEEAFKYSESLSASRPDIDISSQTRIINKTLNECRNKFEAAKDNISRVNASLDILAKCIDFTAALNFLALNPPSPCKVLNAATDDENASILLSWPATGEREIKYVLVRKKGTRPPLNDKDGEVIASSTENLSFRDKNIEPGVIYSYSVFAFRKGRSSQPVSVSKAVLAKVSDIEYSQRDNIIYLSWKTPANCMGVRVSYQHGGVERVISENTVISSISLDNVQLNGRYIFYLSANYPGLGSSMKAKFEVVPTKIIKDFSITSKHVKDNTYEFSWDLNENGIDMQILSSSEVLKRIRSEMRSCNITFQENNYYVVRASANSGGAMKDSLNQIKINTYSPPLIDERKTVIEEQNAFTAGQSFPETRILLFIGGKIPAGLKSYVYFVRSNDNWPTEKDVADKDSDCVDAGVNNNIEISVKAGSSGEIFTSVFAVYNINGNDIVSAPYRKVFNRPLNAELFWKVYKPMFRNYRLDIRIQANRQLDHRPGLILCASSDGMPVRTPGDNNAVKIIEIPPEENINYASDQITASFELPVSLSRGRRINLFVTETSPGETFVMKWESGFNAVL